MTPTTGLESSSEIKRKVRLANAKRMVLICKMQQLFDWNDLDWNDLWNFFSDLMENNKAKVKLQNGRKDNINKTCSLFGNINN